MFGVLDVPAIEQDFRLTRRFVILNGDEDEVRAGAEVDAAEAEFDAREVDAVVENDGFLVECAVAVGVFEDDDAIFAAFAILAPFGVHHAFDHPHAATVVEGECDRLDDVRLTREQRGFEALRQRELGSGLLRWHGFIDGLRHQVRTKSE